MGPYWRPRGRRAYRGLRPRRRTSRGVCPAKPAPGLKGSCGWLPDNRKPGRLASYCQPNLRGIRPNPIHRDDCVWVLTASLHRGASGSHSTGQNGRRQAGLENSPVEPEVAPPEGVCTADGPGRVSWMTSWKKLATRIADAHNLCRPNFGQALRGVDQGEGGQDKGKIKKRINCTELYEEVVRGGWARGPPSIGNEMPCLNPSQITGRWPCVVEASRD